MKFTVIGIAMAVATLIAEVALLLAGEVEAAGITIAFGIMLSYIPRILAEMKGGESPRFIVERGVCHRTSAKDSLAIINELTKENERLRAEVSVKKKLLDKCIDLEDNVRADTVRKMQERLKANRVRRDGLSFKVVDFEAIDRVAAEMLDGE